MMVIGLLAVAAIPTVTGVGQGISIQKKENAASAQAKEQEKFYLTAMVQRDGKWKEMANIMLKDGKLLLDLPDEPVKSYRFLGWYFKYPNEAKDMGVVSYISDDPPALNWIYIDNDTGLLCHGARADTIGHVIGPFWWNEDERFMTLHGREDQFKLKRNRQDGGQWRIYWDSEDELGGHPVRLRRKLQLGIESQYLKDDE